jgi:hypothetical protein
MKSLQDYIVEAEQWLETPAAGDDFDIELEDGTLVETYIMATEGDAILLDATEEIYSVLGQWAQLSEDRDTEVEEDQGAGQVLAKAVDDAPVDTMDEAKYQGREVPLNKKMAGDTAKFKVYVKDPATGNVKKVNFGDKNMRIKKSNPARRKSFRARHNCDNPGSKLKARYWSCKNW